MKKFRTSDSRYRVDPTIIEVEFERETDSSVWIKGQRCNQISTYHIYHDTWQAAYQHLLERAERKLEWAQKNLDRMQKALDEVKRMVK